MIVSLATNGVCYIWASNYTENWSAFAPDFKELEENELYHEREDEFDETDGPLEKKRRIITDEEVDILTIEKISYFSSEEEDELSHVPVVISKDNLM